MVLVLGIDWGKHLSIFSFNRIKLKAFKYIWIIINDAFSRHIGLKHHRWVPFESMLWIHDYQILLRLMLLLLFKLLLWHLPLRWWHLLYYSLRLDALFKQHSILNSIHLLLQLLQFAPLQLAFLLSTTLLFFLTNPFPIITSFLPFLYH